MNNDGLQSRDPHPSWRTALGVDCLGGGGNGMVRNNFGWTDLNFGQVLFKLVALGFFVILTEGKMATNSHDSLFY